MVRVFLAALLLAAPAAAQTPMSAAEFEAFVTGKTLTFAMDGVPYGIEEYRENRQVRWTFIGGQCRLGTWHEEDGSICFEYDAPPGTIEGPQCWRFYREGEGLRAEFTADPEGGAYSIATSNAELDCLGPEIGV